MRNTMSMSISRKQLLASYVMMFILVLMNADHFGIRIW